MLEGVARIGKTLNTHLEAIYTVKFIVTKF